MGDSWDKDAKMGLRDRINKEKEKSYELSKLANRLGIENNRRGNRIDSLESEINKFSEVSDWDDEHVRYWKERFKRILKKKW